MDPIAVGAVGRVAALLVAASFVVVPMTACSTAGSDSKVTTLTGTAYVGEGQVTIKGDDGWYYAVGSDVRWTDAAGSWHQGGKPSCFPPVGESARLKFAATQVTVHGTTWRPVVWVSCQH